MQVKKEEIREKILEAATDEFFKKGYENASMRTIAKKSYTTLGNIYHYYSNKEILLKAVLLPTVEAIEATVLEHIEKRELLDNLTKPEALKYMEHFEELVEQSGFMCVLDKKVVILIKLQSSDLLERKEKILRVLKEHVSEHLNINGDNCYSNILLKMFIECVKSILIEYDDYDEARAEFIKFCKIFCYGIVGIKDNTNNK